MPTNSDIITAAGDLFPKLPGVASSKGVAMNAPPASMLGDITKLVTDAMQTVPDGQHGQLVGIATRNAAGQIDVNIALAVKAGGRVDIVAWMGKSWGQPVAAGVLGRATF